MVLSVVTDAVSSDHVLAVVATFPAVEGDKTLVYCRVVGGKVVVVVPNRHIFRVPAILDIPGAFVSAWRCMALAVSGEETASATKREKANMRAFSSRAFSGDPHGEKHA